jgi:hypothetical protein
MQFFSVCRSDNGQKGGWTQVVDSLDRDLSYANSIKEKFLLTNNQNETALFKAATEKPFGIIDGDFKDAPNRDYGHHKDHIEVLTRYCFENYLCDPILICSLFENVNDFNNVFKANEPNANRFRKNFLQFFLTLHAFRNNHHQNENPENTKTTSSAKDSIF